MLDRDCGVNKLRPSFRRPLDVTSLDWIEGKQHGAWRGNSALQKDVKPQPLRTEAGLTSIQGSRLRQNSHQEPEVYSINGRRLSTLVTERDEHHLACILKSQCPSTCTPFTSAIVHLLQRVPTQVVTVGTVEYGCLCAVPLCLIHPERVCRAYRRTFEIFCLFPVVRALEHVCLFSDWKCLYPLLSRVCIYHVHHRVFLLLHIPHHAKESNQIFEPPPAALTHEVGNASWRAFSKVSDALTSAVVTE